MIPLQTPTRPIIGRFFPGACLQAAIGVPCLRAVCLGHITGSSQPKDAMVELQGLKAHHKEP